jgi:hypothetical protein
MISLLITLLVILVIVYIVHLIIEALGVPEPFRRIAYIILALVVIIYLLRLFGLV